MRLTPTPIAGVVLVEPEPQADERGFFARSFCADTFAAHGLDPCVRQGSLSWNRRAGTLRGMHWQAEPHGEAKLVRCTRGALFDVALDLRPGSPTRLRWHGVELSADNRRALYLAPGIAHGFQTLADDTEVSYQISAPFVPAAARGARWDDPAFAIRWPDCAARTISARDAAWPDWAG